MFVDSHFNRKQENCKHAWGCKAESVFCLRMHPNAKALKKDQESELVKNQYGGFYIILDMGNLEVAIGTKKTSGRRMAISRSCCAEWVHTALFLKILLTTWSVCGIISKNRPGG